MYLLGRSRHCNIYLRRLSRSRNPSSSDRSPISAMSSVPISNNLQKPDPEDELIGQAVSTDDNERRTKDHNTITAPIITQDVFRILGETVYPQKALYGQVLSQSLHGTSEPEQPRFSKVYINSNTPFSAVICGVQGSGKSHSTSTLLESCLIKDPRLGSLPEPLSGLLFHFDTAAGGGNVQPCEAAYLSALHADRKGSANPPGVTVLALPSNIESMKQVYAGLPQVTVKPLHFSPDDISGARLLAMMKVDEHAQMPLYMESIMAILRSMEAQGPFNYALFRERLKKEQFNGGQKAMLNIRLSILDSCLAGGTSENCVSKYFKKGELVIVDLSSPYMDSASACGFFDIILGLFMEAKVEASGKLVVLDEAHKYLSDKGTSSHLTESLLSVIRQQRHLATRVIISTQEPTVVPTKFLELCSFIIAHRFSSPKWLRHLAEHVSAAEMSIDKLLSKISSLGTGEAVMFSPTGLCVQHATESEGNGWSQDLSDLATSDSEETVPTIKTIGQGYLVVRSRLRVTQDGGHSMLAVRNNTLSSRLGPVSVQYMPVQQPAPSSALLNDLPNLQNTVSRTSTVALHTPASGVVGSFASSLGSNFPSTSNPTAPIVDKAPVFSALNIITKQSTVLQLIVTLVNSAQSQGLLLQGYKPVRKVVHAHKKTGPQNVALVVIPSDAGKQMHSEIPSMCRSSKREVPLIMSYETKQFDNIPKLNKPVQVFAFPTGGSASYQKLIGEIVARQ